MKYTSKLSKQYVKSFASKMFKKHLKSNDIEVEREDGIFKVTCKVKKDMFAPTKEVVINFDDFDVKATNFGLLLTLEKAWQNELYEKFGDSYLKDLKTSMQQAVQKEMEERLQKIDAKIKAMKRSASKEK